MKLYAKIIKTWITSYLLYFGGAIAGLGIGVAIFIVQYDLSSEWYTLLALEWLKTPLLYGLAFLLAAVERLVLFLKLRKVKKVEHLPPTEFKFNDFPDRYKSIADFLFEEWD